MFGCFFLDLLTIGTFSRRPITSAISRNGTPPSATAMPRCCRWIFDDKSIETTPHRADARQPLIVAVSHENRESFLLRACAISISNEPVIAITMQMATGA